MDCRSIGGIEKWQDLDKALTQNSGETTSILQRMDCTGVRGIEGKGYLEDRAG